MRPSAAPSEAPERARRRVEPLAAPLAPEGVRRVPTGPALAALGAACAASVVVAVGVGAVWVPPGEILAALARQLGLLPSAEPTTGEAIILLVRLPRVVGGALVGAALAVAGVLYQGLLRNPLADPYVVGASSGAALGATVALLLVAPVTVLGFGLVPLSAFVGALGAVLLVYALARVGSTTPTVNLLLAGFAVSSVLVALMSLLMTMADRLQLRLRVILSWLMGGISVAGWDQLPVVAALILLGILAALPLAARLNAFALGEEAARYVGVDVERVRQLVVALATLLTATAVTISGLIGFVGLVVPHAVRLTLGPDHRRLVPASALAGATFLVLMDAFARSLAAPAELPVGALTGLVGGPVFLGLLRRSGEPRE